jgi:hypothetical protein
MNTDLTTQSEQKSAGGTARRHRLTLIVLGAAVVVASAGGIALARSGDAGPATVPAVRHSAPEFSCVQLAQMGPGGNVTMSDAALASWRQMWTDAHC